MSRASSTMEPLRTLRQRGSVAMGVVAMVLSAGMAVFSAVSGEASVTFIGLMLLLCGGSWVFLVRPSVVLTQAGLELNNPFRRTSLPWSRIEDVSPRWNLEVWADGNAYPAWAVASHVQRPQSQGMLGFGRLGAAAAADTAAAPKPSEGATVASASRLIETAMGEYAELVAEGDSAVVTGGDLTRRWQWVDVVCVAGPALVVAVGAFVL